MAELRFPDGFLWGAATAAFQIEGACRADGRGESIWDRFCREPGRIAGGGNAETACDHYRRWRGDVALMAELGLTAYRFSISWSRVMPEGTGRVNPKGMDFYSALVDALLEKGVRPLVTLYHWDLPQALQDRFGGWIGRETAGAFGDYVSAVARALGDRVGDWLTLSEPMSFAWDGYVTGGSAPGVSGGAAGLAAVHNAMRAHGRAATALRAARSGARVGIALSLSQYEPASDRAGDVAACRRVEVRRNAFFLDAVLRGRYPAAAHELMPELARFIQPSDADEIRAPVDFLGVNYYASCRVAEARPPAPTEIVLPAAAVAGAGAGAAPVYGSGGAERIEPYVDPEGLHRMLLRLRDEYSLRDVLVTGIGYLGTDERVESGRVHDGGRIECLREHLAAAHRAITDGIRVGGVFVWSLIDNFEWAHGYAPRFGLAYVDYPTQTRIVKDSGRWFSECARANAMEAG